MLSLNNAKKLNTASLLRYYKAERNRYYHKFGSMLCDCGCGEFYWDLYPNLYETEKKEVEQRWEHMNMLKSILADREHVQVKKKKK